MKIHGTLSLYFEVKDSEVFGGPGEVGYTETKINFNSEDLEWINLQKYAQAQIETVAGICKVPQENVRIISRTEYEENTEDDLT